MSINWTTAPRDPWFKIGSLEVGSTMFVVLWVAVSWVACALAPAALGLLGFAPSLVMSGQVWRVFTWPLANQVGIWALLNLFFFFVFGSEVEAQIGRVRMARFLAGIWASLTIASLATLLLLQAVFPSYGGSILMGIGQIQFLLFLVWIFENPNRPFFFNIPAWVVGAVFVGLQVLQMVGRRDLAGFVELLMVAFFVAVMARRQGLLSQYSWIPGRPVNKPSRAQRQAQKGAADRARDAARLDQLLDKISAQGMDSLSAAERRELMKLRNRRQ